MFVTKPPVVCAVEEKMPRKKKPDYWVGKTSFGAVSSFERGVAGSLFEMLRSGFHPFSGIGGNVWAFPHSEGVERTRSDGPLIASAGRHFTGNTSAALLDAKCPAGFQWAVGCSIGRTDTHSVGPERAFFMLAGFDYFEIVFLHNKITHSFLFLVGNLHYFLPCYPIDSFHHYIFIYFGYTAFQILIITQALYLITFRATETRYALRISL